MENERFSTDCRRRIERSDRVGVSPVSCYELALAHRRQRLRLPCEPAEWFVDALEPAGVELLQISPAIAAQAVALPDIHRDPFDRLIMATALEYGAELATVDEMFKRYPEVTGRLI